MEPFTFFGLGLGLGFAWLMRDLQPLGGSGQANTAPGSLDDDGHEVADTPFAEAPETRGGTSAVASVVHHSTRLLSEDESEEAAEALRSAIRGRR